MRTLRLLNKLHVATKYRLVKNLLILEFDPFAMERYFGSANEGYANIKAYVGKNPKYSASKTEIPWELKEKEN